MLIRNQNLWDFFFLLKRKLRKTSDHSRYMYYQVCHLPKAKCLYINNIKIAYAKNIIEYVITRFWLEQHIYYMRKK